MAQLVREIMIEATPETIWPFLTEPESLVGWHGTVAEIDPRPGGIYACSSPVNSNRRASTSRSFPWRRWCSPSAGTRTTTRFQRDRPPSRSRYIAKGTRPVCASCTRACRTTRSTTTAMVGRCTSNGSRCASREGTRDLTADPVAKRDGQSDDFRSTSRTNARDGRDGSPRSCNDNKGERQ